MKSSIDIDIDALPKIVSSIQKFKPNPSFIGDSNAVRSLNQMIPPTDFRQAPRLILSTLNHIDHGLLNR